MESAFEIPTANDTAQHAKSFPIIDVLVASATTPSPPRTTTITAATEIATATKTPATSLPQQQQQQDRKRPASAITETAAIATATEHRSLNTTEDDQHQQGNILDVTPSTALEATSASNNNPGPSTSQQQQQEESILSSSSLTAIVKTYLNDENFVYRMLPPRCPLQQSGRTFMFDLTGRHSTYRVALETKPNIQRVACFVHCPVRARDRKWAVGEFLHRCNYSLDFSNAEMDYDDGEIRSRACIDIEGGVLVPAMVRTLVHSAAAVMDRLFLPLIQILYGPAERLESLNDFVLQFRNPTTGVAQAAASAAIGSSAAGPAANSAANNSVTNSAASTTTVGGICTILQ